MSSTLSKSVHNKILKEIIADKLDKVKPAKKPRCFLLGGQPGAGKGGMRRAIEGGLREAPPLVIDPDELRAYHPRYAEFVEMDPDNAANKVHTDAMLWASELRQAAIDKRVNIVIDGTLGNPSAAIGIVNEVTEGGYQVEVHVVATSIEVSKQAVRSRFEKAFVQCEENGDAELPRNVPEHVQNTAYRSIPSTITQLCSSGKVSRMRVANRNGDSLSDITSVRAVKKNGGVSANSSLETERNRPWTMQELEEYEQTGTEIVKLMKNRLEKIDDSTKDGERAKQQLSDAIEKQEQDMQSVHTEKSKSMVSDEEALDQRLVNTKRTVKKDSWLKKFLGSIFKRKKKSKQTDELESL
jgi:predicted ABC-type ATPase